MGVGVGESRTINVPLNRVEGDLEVRVSLEDGVVTDAWCSGTMYRGVERLLAGREALDGLVITPRICGICSTAHLSAAAAALDVIAKAAPPPGAVLLRNLTLGVEHLQSDIRHGFLMFTADFVNPRYKDLPLYREAAERYAPFRGSAVVETVRETKKLLEIIAVIGGQWPHSSYMVPGGITSVPGRNELLQCRLVLEGYRRWYERRVLGCSIERFREVETVEALDDWLDEQAEHRESELGFFLRYARAIGLNDLGTGPDTYLSYGLPQVSEAAGGGFLVPPGFRGPDGTAAFNHRNVAEHVAYSWYEDYGGGRHPFDGETRPYASGSEGGRYSWSKAPRYDDHPAETGPLAEALLTGDPLITRLEECYGGTPFVRQIARLLRATRLVPALERWLREAGGCDEFYRSPGEIADGEGVGLVSAARGALGHWVRVERGLIAGYQIITPTAWNASPRDTDGRRGPLEEALVGVTVRDPENPVELGHVARSFDLCLVCTVHLLDGGAGCRLRIMPAP